MAMDISRWPFSVSSNNSRLRNLNRYRIHCHTTCRCNIGLHVAASYRLHAAFQLESRLRVPHHIHQQSKRARNLTVISGYPCCHANPVQGFSTAPHELQEATILFVLSGYELRISHCNMQECKFTGAHPIVGCRSTASSFVEEADQLN